MHSPYSRTGLSESRMPLEPCGSQQEARLRDQCGPQPMTVGNLLKYFGIGAKAFCLVVVTDHGIDYYAGPNEIHNPGRLFDKEAFLQTQGQAGLFASSSTGEENLYDGKTRAHMPSKSFSPQVRPITTPSRPAQSGGRGNPGSKRNKRLRTPKQITLRARERSIRINDADALQEFYDQKLKMCHQMVCRVIAKAWIKAVEPKKQSTYPYTKDVAPSWWPQPWGQDESERVRHKEPDHLLKPERLVLLRHILQMIVEPKETQHQAVLNVGLDVRKLEKITMESFKAFFGDRERPRNAESRGYLKQIFEVAKCEQRYKNGEIDGKTLVQVLADEKLPAGYQSDDDEDDEDDDEDEFGHSMTPGEGSLSPPHEQQHPPAARPVPESHYTSPIQLTPNMGAAGGIRTGYRHNSYGEVAPHPHALPLPVPSDTVPGHTSVGQRPHMSAPVGFNLRPQPNMNMNGRTGTSAQTTAPMYAFTPQPQQSAQQTYGAGSFMAHTNMPLGSTPASLPPTSDAMGRQYGSG